MATTPNKGWPYPVGTDFVVDGDNAIRAVADMLDARMGMYVLPPASVVNGTINADGSVTCNASSGWVELRNVFDARFRFFRVVFNIKGANAAGSAIRFMKDSVQSQDAGAYTTQRWFASGTATQGATGTDTFAQVGVVLYSQQSGEITIFDALDAATPTTALASSHAAYYPGGSGILRSAPLAENGIAIQKMAGDTKGFVKVYGI